MNGRRRAVRAMGIFATACLLLAGLLSAGETAEPVNPFAPPAAAETLPGAVFLSDGSVLVGAIRLTPGKPLTVFDPAEKKYVRLPLDALREVRVAVKREREEKEWRFKDSGSPEKTYTGQTYVRLDFAATFVLKDGTAIETDQFQGAPVYVLPDPPAAGGGDTPADAPEKPQRLMFLLRPIRVGEPGQKVKDMPYVQRIALGEEAKAEALAELARRRGVQAPGPVPAPPANAPQEAPAPGP